MSRDHRISEEEGGGRQGGKRKEACPAVPDTQSGLSGLHALWLRVGHVLQNVLVGGD